ALKIAASANRSHWTDCETSASSPPIRYDFWKESLIAFAMTRTKDRERGIWSRLWPVSKESTDPRLALRRTQASWRKQDVTAREEPEVAEHSVPLSDSAFSYRRH